MDVQYDRSLTNEALTSFQIDKEGLMKSGAELRAIALSLGKMDATQKVSTIIKELSEERFHLAILGSFKRGKSTFINALLGSSILPTGVVPLTSVVTKLAYDIDTSASVLANDGSRKNIDVHDLEDYITERGNPGNAKNIAEVEVLVDSPLLGQGIILVDTPGIGSTYLNNTRSTHDFLNKLDAAIIIIGSDPPIGQVELDFVHEVMANVEKTFFVQNKIDNIQEKEWREAMQFSQNVLHDSLDMEVKLYPLSSLNALRAKLTNDREMLIASGLPVLEMDLKHFVSVEKGQLLIRSASRKLQRIVSDLRTAVDIEQRVMGEKDQTLNEKISWLDNEMRTVRLKIDEIGYLVDGGVDSVAKSFDDDLGAFAASSKPLLLSQLDGFFEKLGSDLSARIFAERTERFLSEAITRIYAPFIDKQEETFATSFREIVKRFEREANALDENFQQVVSDTFDIEIAHTPPSTLNLGKSRFYFDRSAVLNYNSVIPAEMPFLLPKPLYQKTMKKRAVNTLTADLDKYGGRIRYDLVYRLSENARTVKSEQRSRLLSTIEIMKEAVQAGLKLRDRTQDEKVRRAKEIDTTKLELDRIQSYLGSL